MCIYLSKLKSLLLIAGIFLIISTESRVADANTLRNHPRNGIPHQRQLFGIELSLPARRLLAEVEQSYGKHVRDEVAINWETVQLGYSFVADDGTPVIQINDNLERKEEVIVHELFHLKQRAKGFYMINFVFSSGAAYYKYAAYCKLLLMLLHEPLQHWIFYPEMRKAGFDPSAVLKADFERAREAGQLADLQAGTTRALTYLL